MNKILSLLLFLSFYQSTQAASLFSISNNMMTSTGEFGSLELGMFDPFNPSLNCNTYTAPNTCMANGRDPVHVSLAFNYSITLDALTGSSVDLFFNVDNGIGGAGEFINVSPPSNLLALHDGDSGNFDLSFDIPLFGPNSHNEYSLDLVVDVTINP